MGKCSDRMFLLIFTVAFVLGLCLGHGLWA